MLATCSSITYVPVLHTHSLQWCLPQTSVSRIIYVQILLMSYKVWGGFHKVKTSPILS